MKKTFVEVINKLYRERDKNGNKLDMISVIVSDERNVYEHNFKDEMMVDVRSIAKPIVCLALGSAIEEGLYFENVKIELDTKIYPFLKKISNLEDINLVRKWNDITLMDCFRITMGHDKGIMFSSDVNNQNEDNLVNYILNYPITHEIGNHFVYSNAGTYLVSALITEYLGINLDELVDKFIFKKIGISKYEWKKYGKYCAGCTGLKLYNGDLHKIGRLIINNGMYDNQLIVPESWIEKMRTPQVPSPTHRYIKERAYPKWSYGMNLWICEDGNYYCDGTNGQYLIVLPERKLVITATGNQSDTSPVSGAFGLFKEAIE